MIFLEGCCFISLSCKHLHSSVTSKHQQGANVPVVLTAEELGHLGCFYCKSNVIAGSPGKGNNYLITDLFYELHSELWISAAAALAVTRAALLTP